MRFFILCAASALAYYVITQEGAAQPVKRKATRVVVKPQRNRRPSHAAKSRPGKPKAES